MVESRQSFALPEGPVTIMFTDIEGSTALRTSLGDRETDELFRQHDELIRKLVAEHNGYDQHAALGDGFLVVFVSTKRAVACAIAIQRALDAFNRTRSGTPLQVRIGLNTGEVTQNGDQISGEAVHAAARVCAAASGRQVFVSDITRQLAGTIPDVTFRDTGEHQLKGFPAPWRLYDVVWVRESTGTKQQVFVARDEQLSALRGRLAAALEGNGSLVLIGGEPGVGKTALVRQLIREAEQRGALAVFGRCYESEGTVAYSPFVEMLEQALSVMPPDVVREDMSDDAPEIARMVPELRRRFPDIPDALEIPPEQQRRYFFNAVAAFIARGAKRFPLLMVMDDIHWADESTLLLIEHIAQLVPGQRVLGIGTYRDVELEVSRPLAASLERMVRAGVVDRIQLSRFGVSDVSAMIEALAGQTPPTAVVDAVFSETEGNPFFVGEVYRHLVEEGRLFAPSGEFRADVTIDELDVPESVRLVVGRRLERLGAEPQKALAAAAVIGRGFPFRLLEQVVEMPASALLDIVDDAEAAQVLMSEERDGEVYFSFAHELIRQTLLSGLSVLRRQRLHLAVADAIERLDVNAIVLRPQELADHLLKAGAAAEPKRLVNMLTAAADRALSGAAFESALRLADDAFALTEEADERRADLLELRAKALRALGRLSESIETWQQAIGLHIDAGNLASAALVSYQMGVSQMWLGDFDSAFGSFYRGVEAVGDSVIPERLFVAAGLSSLVGFSGLYEQAVSTAKEAEEAVGEVHDDRALGALRWTQSLNGWNYGKLQDCVVNGREAVARLRTTNDAWSIADAQAWLAFGLLWMGEFDEGRATAAEGAELAMKVGHTGTYSLCARGVAWADYMISGDIDTCERAAREDLPILESINSPWVSLTHGWLAAMHNLQGRYDEALHDATESIRLMPPCVWTGFGESAELRILASMGERERVLELIEDPRFPASCPVDDARGAGAQFRYHATLQVVAQLGLTDHAIRLYPDAARLSEVYRYVWFDFTISERLAGMVALTAGLLDEAEAHFDRAARVAVDDPNVADAPRVELWRARLMLVRGRPEEREKARRLVLAAREEFVRRGEGSTLAQADALLREFESGI